ncbi:BTB/POZ domain-containing protein 1-like isoform X1 [Frankliniella occidentalis]|uniref:BTB/POZ domain-containing protein 1-like isoform X1 n=2 Tax=Frankliniella occidentalis TaxID=133901 RepID=A0A9C6XR22_FRAOC|nr:BTB/POZ domain-containing protein 1-like isoform X1 [Frankliniella occidentalis]
MSWTCPRTHRSTPCSPSSSRRARHLEGHGAQAVTTAPSEDQAGLRPFTYVASMGGLWGPRYPATWDCCTTQHIDDNVLLLDNEAESDVEFVVGPDGDTWRIPGHRDVLSASSPVFKAMLTGPLANDSKVRVDDIDGRAFYQLLRVLYGAVPEIRSEQTCLLTMYAANKYLCTRLFLHCVEMADGFLRPANVLRVMQAIRFFLPDDLDVDEAFTPSAPPLEEGSDGEHGVKSSEAATAPCTPLLETAKDKDKVPQIQAQRPTPCPMPMRLSLGVQRVRVEPGPAPIADKDFPDPDVEANMGWYCSALYWNCLQFVDAYIDDVFECECVEELHHDDLVTLLRRDSLHVRREARLFSALARWADRECKRRGERSCADNKRRALGEALYLVRYLRMSMVELLAGPIKSGLLDSHETAWILGLAVGNPQPSPPDSLRPFAHLLDAPRPAPRPCYIHLSLRSMERTPIRKVEGCTMTDWSCPVDMSEAEVKRQVKALKEIAKKQKKEEKRLRRLQGRPDQNGCCSKCSSGCFAEVFFSVLACIFD